MSEVFELFQIQQADSKITEYVKEVQQLKTENSHKILFAQRKKAYEDAKLALRSNQKSLKEASHEESSLQAKAKELNKKLYSGKSFATKELEEQQTELNNTNDRIAILEETILELMDITEKQEKELQKMEKDMVLYEREAVQRQAAINRKIVRLVDDAKAIKVKRDSLAEHINPLLLSRYDDLRRQKNGIAVASIVKDCCTGCGMKLTHHKIQEVENGLITTCGTCCRILYRHN